eukprot:12930162-Alexandrium_andersonii.AAC.1
MSKAVHKLRCTRCAHYLTPWVRDTQCGGFGGRSTDFATHSLRPMLAAIKARRRTPVVLFVDV